MLKNLAQRSANRLEFITLICQEFSFDPDKCYLSASKYTVHISIDQNDVPPGALRDLKRAASFEVPSWEMRYQSDTKSIQASETVELASGEEVTVVICLGGAYLCEKVGEEEVEPSESDHRRAEALMSLTPEEALARVQSEANELLKVKTRPTFRCKPAGR